MSIRIPRLVDQASTDTARLPCIVVEVCGTLQASYRLQSEYGVLKRCFPASELAKMPGASTLPVQDDWETSPRISLREAARCLNPDFAAVGLDAPPKGALA